MESDKYQQLRKYLKVKASSFFHTYSLPRWMLFIHDNVVVFLAFIFAYLLRYNLIPADFLLDHALVQGLIVLIVYASFEIVFKSYAGLIRHTTLTDISLVFASTSASMFVLFIMSLFGSLLKADGYEVIPVSIILIHYVLVNVVLFFMRIFVKMVFRFATSAQGSYSKRVLIYGAGEMGFVVKRVLLSDPKGIFRVFGFIDDNRSLQGKKINGIQVYGREILSKAFLEKNKVETLILAIHKISPVRKSGILLKAINCGLEILETPAIDKWLNGQLEVRQLQKVRFEDLLGREPIQLDMEMIGTGLNNRTILVTGAAGSIGSEIVRQLSRFSVQKIILVDQAETPMFHLENELRKGFGHLNFKTQLADVTNFEKMDLIFQKFRPEIVFHAAAYKHVPLMEGNPHEALRVNVGGTKLISDLAVKYNVKKFVMISTDKSVNPTNIMGASKRVCELLVQSKAVQQGVKTQFVVTRFGNVLGSNGSVIPLFTKQIHDGGPVTVTHPDITRYFMTIPEACELVLEAGFMGKGGEIFVFDMGKPVKIVDLARNMIRLSGLEPDKDIKIEFTGLRAGEKLFEELLSDLENLLPTHHSMIKIAQPGGKEYSQILLKIKDALDNLYSMPDESIVAFFEDIVPEYKHSKEINGHSKSEPVTQETANGQIINRQL